VQDYLKEEIIAEGLTRNIPAFSRFTDIIGFCNGEMINFTNIARDTGVDAKTVREYFNILTDTMIGRLIEPFSRKNDRNVINKTPKFYLFDVGLAHYLSKSHIEEERGAEFGRAFEHFILMELCAHCAYSEADYPISYWRTVNGYEIDFILGSGRIAVEVKSNPGASGADFKGLLRFIDDYSPSRAIVVSNERARRTIGAIEIIPWGEFLDELWAGKVIS
jgi:predicted AAA+ superfamily ATPase